MEKLLDYLVFPSEERTISVEDDDTYGGAHTYMVRASLGFTEGKAEYLQSRQVIEFVKKQDDGKIIPGLQSEQLAYILWDRTKKLNDRFPSEYNAEMLRGLTIFLAACEDRVKDRMNRGVMGELKS